VSPSAEVQCENPRRCSASQELQAASSQAVSPVKIYRNTCENENEIHAVSTSSRNPEAGRERAEISSRPRESIKERVQQWRQNYESAGMKRGLQQKRRKFREKSAERQKREKAERCRQPSAVRRAVVAAENGAGRTQARVSEYI